MNKRILNTSILVMASAMMMLSFQNCSQTYGLGTVDASMASQSKADPGLSPGGSPAVTNPATPQGPSDPVAGTVGSQDPSTSGGAQTPGNSGDPEDPNAPVAITPVPVKPGVDPSVPTDEEVAAICRRFQGEHHVTQLEHGGCVRNNNGPQSIEIDSADEIVGNEGPISIRGVSSVDTLKPTIARIERNHGKLIICNANVDLIDGQHGNIIIYNGTVKVMKNCSGAVRLVNSKILEVENHDGKIIDKN